VILFFRISAVSVWKYSPPQSLAFSTPRPKHPSNESGEFPNDCHRKRQQQQHYNEGDDRMLRDQPHHNEDKPILCEAENPVTKWLRADIDGRSRRRFCRMGSQSDPTTSQRSDDLPLRFERADHAIGEQGAGYRADDRMNSIPDAVDERNLVGDKFHNVKNDCSNEHWSGRKNRQTLRQVINLISVHDAEPFSPAENATPRRAVIEFDMSGSIVLRNCSRERS
jgi:hypothetical protein